MTSDNLPRWRVSYRPALGPIEPSSHLEIIAFSMVEALLSAQMELAKMKGGPWKLCGIIEE